MNKTTETNFLVRLAKFFLPFILGFGVFGAIGFLMDETLRVAYWPLISGYFFPPFGKESIIPAGVLAGIDPLIMALSIAFVDVVVALFLVWNYDLAKKIPIIGKFMIKVEEKGSRRKRKFGGRKIWMDKTTSIHRYRSFCHSTFSRIWRPCRINCGKTLWDETMEYFFRYLFWRNNWNTSHCNVFKSISYFCKN
jgi:hypothetical protein